MVTEVELGSEGIAYIRAYLSEGKELSRYLLKLPLEQGRVVSYLPPTVNPDASREFEVGGQSVLDMNSQYEIGTEAHKIVGPLGAANELHLANFISAYLSQPGKRYAIFEHALAEPGDLWLSQTSIRFFTCDTGVYIFLNQQDASLDAILAALRAARTYRLTGILSGPTSFPEIPIGHEVTLDVLRVLAATTAYVIVGAYDGEGELIWSGLD
jgi:hypothetical protein